MRLNNIYIKVLLLLIVAANSVSLVSAERLDASDMRITWVGRTSFDYGGSVSFDWTGVYCRIRCTGDTLRLRIADTKRNYYNVYIDREMSEEPSQVIVTMGDSVYTIPLCRCRKVHNITLQKRTEAEQGRSTFYYIETNGHFVQAESLRKRQIEFIGDSYTCGYGIENCDSTDHFTPETENVSKTYASIIAHRLKADYQVIAHSGMGVCRNYNSKFPGWTMPKRYKYRFDMDSVNDPWYGNSEWCPITVILLGGNDFSCGVTPDYEQFRDAYFSLLKELPDSMLVLCCTKTKNTELSRYVERVVLECDHPNAYFFACDFDAYTNHRRNLGADKHPNERAHRRLAEQIYSYLRKFW